ncbi:hypothetical protein [Kitasatospora purpeofusca]|uniref:hypothetical protein n=1 Tax=Kitasatospora purpeofusca TaxID=67352 RepID=UPI002256774B|nr:hypothetical protein [Kitasatospora purpeofusca]MCX4752463.1 hypothetical protein [Kitasatospora purpeofusca]WSR32034.1 hypothetical protein OG715_14210 [Kitasatospora purpeofusca]
MNPHDPLKKPGAHLVFDRLGAEDPQALAAGHLHESPIAHLAQMIATTSRDVDDLHRDLTTRAQLVIERLEPIARGDHAAMRGTNGVIQSTGFQVELLAARRGAAYQQLTRAIYAYERCAEAGPPSTAPERKRVRDNAPVTPGQSPANGSTDLCAAARPDPEGFEREALRDVNRGDLCLSTSPVHGDKYINYTDGGGAPVHLETVENLIVAGLIATDTSTASYRPGQRLSLTQRGETALDAAHTSDRRRMHAALLRSAASDPSSEPTPGTAPGVLAAPPARTR